VLFVYGHKPLLQGNQTNDFLEEYKPNLHFAKLLLDPRPLAVKIEPFRTELAENNPRFAEFIIGEHALREGRWQQAKDAYERCRSQTLEIEKNDWLATKVESRLYQLATKNQDAGTPRP